MVERAIAAYGHLDESGVIDRQRAQVELLIDLEDKFAEALMDHLWGRAVWKKFLNMILDEKRNILSARVFFRERQPVFSAEISPAIRARDIPALTKFHFNFSFVKFAMDAYDWGETSRVKILAEQIKAARMELVETNLPLAISRARVFWSRTPKAHLSYMDLVQISVEGLLAAIDKFCLPYVQGAFSGVACQRMTGFFIDQYSETLIHFYPSDRRKLYRANKLIGRQTVIDFDMVSDGVNAAGAGTTTSSEIFDLVSAATCVAVDATPVPNDDHEHHDNPIDRYSADDDYRPDLQVEHAEVMVHLHKAYDRLTVFERKLLKLKGVSL